MRTPTEKLIIISIACFLSAFVSQPVLAQKSKTIYHKDWIDLNKNGRKTFTKLRQLLSKLALPICFRR